MSISALIIVFLYQLQGASFHSLEKDRPAIAVVDIDDASLSFRKIRQLKEKGVTLFSYLSIGEAEDYRTYWREENLRGKRDSVLLSENPNWAGNYKVKFWDPRWQRIMKDRIKMIAKSGYGGAYLDIIDAYQNEEVQEKYRGDLEELKHEMIEFVATLGKVAKKVNPDFKMIPQNGLDLLAYDEFLEVIDGVGVEDTWTNDDELSSWSKAHIKLLQRAREADKFILATDYPKDPSNRRNFVGKAVAEGFIPFVGNRALNLRASRSAQENRVVFGLMESKDMSALEDVVGEEAFEKWQEDR